MFGEPRIADVLRRLQQPRLDDRLLELVELDRVQADQDRREVVEVLDREERVAALGTVPADAPASEITKPYEEKFVAAMDDDFNTAGAIGAMHECAGVINAEIEKTGVENAKDPAALARLAAAADLAAAPPRPLYLRAPDATPPTRLPGQARGPKPA